ncbi:MAG: VOC family protein [Dehalococcoidia bacterium]|nr:VOC family protein [Dehalococcoidia bacterium]
MAHGVVHFEIPATDPDKVADFYRQLFGWQIDKMSVGESEYWFVMSGPVDEQGAPKESGYINGGLYRRQMPDQTPVNYVDVESVDEYTNKARALGAKVVMEKTPVPGMGWFSLLADPDGNSFGVWQNDTAAG